MPRESTRPFSFTQALLFATFGMMALGCNEAEERPPLLGDAFPPNGGSPPVGGGSTPGNDDAITCNVSADFYDLDLSGNPGTTTTNEPVPAFAFSGCADDDGDQTAIDEQCISECEEYCEGDSGEPPPCDPSSCTGSAQATGATCTYPLDREVYYRIETIPLLNMFRGAANLPTDAGLEKAPYPVDDPADFDVDSITGNSRLWVASRTPGGAATNVHPIDVVAGVSPNPFEFGFGASAFGVVTENSNQNLLLLGGRGALRWFTARYLAGDFPNNEEYGTGESDIVELSADPATIETTITGTVAVRTAAGDRYASGPRETFSRCGSSASSDAAFAPSGALVRGAIQGANGSRVDDCDGVGSETGDFILRAIAASQAPDPDLEETWADECDEDPALCLEDVNNVIAVGVDSDDEDLGKLIWFPDGDLTNPQVKELGFFVPQDAIMVGRTQYAVVVGLSGSTLVARLYNVVTDPSVTDLPVLMERTLEGSAAQRVEYCCQNAYVLTGD